MSAFVGRFGGLPHAFGDACGFINSMAMGIKFVDEINGMVVDHRLLD